MLKKISFRIRRTYFNRIVSGEKDVELRKNTPFWRKRLLCANPPSIAVFVCGKDVHRRWTTLITVGKPEEILGRGLSDQGKKDIQTETCIATYLGNIYTGC